MKEKLGTHLNLREIPKKIVLGSVRVTILSILLTILPGCDEEREMQLDCSKRDTISILKNKRRCQMEELGI